MSTNLVYGEGIYEIGKYRAKVDNVHTPEYKCWSGMLRRCYDEKFYDRNPTYRGCHSSDLFKNFQLFAEWYWSQVGAGDKTWHLDKDLISKGNMLYSEGTCFLLPPEINTAFDKKRSVRGPYPVGVTKIDNGYVSRVNVGGTNRKYLGYFKTPEEAFTAHKVAKEAHLKNLANKYQGLVDPRVCEILRNWKICIED